MNGQVEMRQFGLWAKTCQTLMNWQLHVKFRFSLLILRLTHKWTPFHGCRNVAP